MSEYRLFEEGTTPEYTTREWYLHRPHAPHLEEPGHRERLLLTAELVNELVLEYRLKSVSDLGCGDGGLLSLISAPEKRGYDLSPEAVKAATEERHVDAKVADVLNDGWVQPGQLAIVTEFLEHLVDPHGFVRRLHCSCRAIVASSPWNECPPNPHYEFHTWAWDTDGYRAMIEQGGFRVLRHERVCNFQVISAVRA